MVALSVPPQRLPVNLVRSGRKQPQREHRVPGCGWRGRLHFRPAIFRTPPPLLSVALQYLLDLSAALHFLERLQYRFHRNLCESRTMQLTAVSSSCAASWSGGCPGAWRLLQCSDS